MKALILAEWTKDQLKPATRHVLTAAFELNAEIDMLIIGEHCDAVSKEAAVIAGVSKVYVADHVVYAHQLAENAARLIAQLGKDYQYILAPATTFGKNIMPRAAALLGVNMLSDVIAVLSPNTFERPMYAGNVMAVVETTDPIKILTIRTTAFSSRNDVCDKPAPIQSITEVIPNSQSQFESESLTQSTRPELTNAKIVISGGRGLKSAENFKLIEALADKLGAAVGASRAAVDAGFAPNDYQVGQTGKIVAPDLYIAIGISGAIQHLAGMKDSKVIVAINSDSEAPIFQSADYILVGDLFKILPEMQAALT